MYHGVIIITKLNMKNLTKLNEMKVHSADPCAKETKQMVNVEPFMKSPSISELSPNIRPLDKLSASIIIEQCGSMRETSNHSNERLVPVSEIFKPDFQPYTPRIIEQHAEHQTYTPVPFKLRLPVEA